MRLDGKKAIITGPVKGLGKAITEKMAKEGADLLLAGRDVAAIEEVAAEVRSYGRTAEVVQVDVTSVIDVKTMVEKALKTFDGRIDILVNVAGVTGPIETPVDGLVREYLMLRDHITLTTMFERRVIPPYGLQGGRPGAPFRCTLVRADGEHMELPGKTNIGLRVGDRIILESSGGGGFGPPVNRQHRVPSRRSA